MNRAATRILLLVLVGAAASCADGPEESISSRGQWCDVVREVDDRFTAADTEGDPFDERQAAYADIVDELDRLERGLEHVAEYDDPVEAAAWISDNCGVDING